MNNILGPSLREVGSVDYCLCKVGTRLRHFRSNSFKVDFFSCYVFHSSEIVAAMSVSIPLFTEGNMHLLWPPWAAQNLSHVLLQLLRFRYKEFPCFAHGAARHGLSDRKLFRVGSTFKEVNGISNVRV